MVLGALIFILVKELFQKKKH